MNFGSQILILYAVGFFALLNNSCKSDRTIALLILYDNSLQNFASPQGIWIFHSSLFVLHLLYQLATVALNIWSTRSLIIWVTSSSCTEARL